MDCRELKAVDLPEGLNYIGTSCFCGTGLESVKFPASLRTLCQAAFAMCKNLRRVEFCEGLAVLGTNEYPSENENFQRYYGVFGESALESVKLPKSLKRIEYSAFAGCKNLRSIAFPERLEYIGKWSF